MEKNQIECEISAIAQELLEKMGFSVELETTQSSEREGVLFICNIKTEESSFLIGQYGTNLQALQHIVRVLVRKRIAEPVNFVLDVNDYRKEKNEAISRLALNLASEACAKKEAVVMRPMTAYERRIVHMELDKDDRVKVVSIGEGEDRRIEITPLEQ